MPPAPLAPVRLPRTLITTGLTGGLVVAAGAATVAAAPPATALTPAHLPAYLPAAVPATLHVTALPALPNVLLLGSTGSYVAVVQTKLGVTADGVFGPITRAAVLSFQRENGLAADGVVGPYTWAALQDGGSPTRPLLKIGATGSYVVDLQRRLGITSDGDFGAITQSAVMSFQSRYHLLVDGEVGAQTWAVLLKVGSASSADSSATTTISSGGSSSSLSLGERAVAIASEQAGKPYVYGGAGPDSFDCSGLVMYVYGQLGYSLPHNADDQYHSVRSVPQSDLQIGDIVFLPNSNGYVTHDGIYAGDGYWWVARYPGTVIERQQMYTDNYYVGRVG